MERFLTSEAIRLGLAGLVAGLAAGLVWRMAGRVRWGAAPFVLAVLVAARLTGRSDSLRWGAMTAAGVLITVLAGLGAVRLLADPAIGWAWVASGTLISTFGVYAGVPETGPPLLVGGAVAGLAATAALARSRWLPTAGGGLGAVMGWAALSGAAGRPWAAVGGALCTGLAPWFALRPLLPTLSLSRPPRPWLLAAHALLVIVAARWIGVDPHAGWRRVAVVATVGLAVAMTTRRQA